MNRMHWLFLASMVAVLSLAGERAAFAQGIFSTASTAGGDQDANVGLSSAKTYFNAINVNGGNLTINGVNFLGNNGDATWSHTNFPNALVSENGSNITGQFGTLEDSFRFGIVPATQTVTLSGLTPGQNYITTFYNPNWDFGNNTARTSFITSTSGATVSYNENPGAALAMSILRYTFVASGASETVSFNNAGAAGSTHLYGFTTEQTFNKSWVSGANWSTATWSPAGTPNGQGTNAAFGAQASPTSISLDVPVTLGHLQLDGANAWTVSGPSTLTLQPDLGGVSVLSTPAGSHSISAVIAGIDPIIKLGAGTMMLTGNNTFSGLVTVNAGTLEFKTIANTGTSSSLGTGSGSGPNGRIVIANGDLKFTGATTQTVNRNIAWEAGATGALDASGASGAALQISDSANNPYNNPGARAFTFSGTNTDANTFSVALGNAGGASTVNKTGPGTWVLSGANTYTGPTNISGGTLKNGSATTFSGANTSLAMSGSSTFDLNGFNASVSNVTASAATNTITNSGAADATLTLTDSSATINALLTDGGTNKLGLAYANANSSTFVALNSLNTFSGGITLLNNASGTRMRIGTPIVTVGSPGAITSGTFGRGAITIGTAATDKAQILFDTLGGQTLANELVFNTALGTDAAGGIRLDTTGNTLSGKITANLANASFNTTFAGVSATVSGQVVGANGVAKLGAGTVFLTNNSNTYTGETRIEAGTLNVSSVSNYGVASSIGSRAAGQDVPTDIGLLFRGGTLQYTGATAQSTDRAIRVSTSGGAFIDASGSNPAATLSFTRTAASPDFFENGGARQITFTGTNTGNNTFAMPITEVGGATTVNKTGSGRWVLPSAATYSGTTNIQQGILQIENSDALGTGGFVAPGHTIISNGAALHINGSLTIPEHFHLQGTGPDGLGAIRSLAGTSSINANVHVSLDAATTIGVNAGSQLTINSQIYDNVSMVGSTLTKLGAGTLTLSHPGTFTTPYYGATQVQGGTLEVTVNGALGATNGDTTVSNGARLLLSGANYTTKESLNINGAGIGGVGTDGALRATGASRWDGDITAQTNATIYVPAGSTLALGNSGSPAVITKNGTTLTFDGGGVTTVNSQITGATDHTSDLDINGGSTVVLTNINNNYMGPTNINNGTLQNGASNVVPDGSEITFGSAGALSTFDLASFNETVRGLSSSAAGNGVVRNSVNATNSTLTLAPQGVETWTFTGAIQQNPGTVNLVMTGAAGSTQRLGGTNTYTGTTTVNSGTLELLSTGSLQNSAVTVNGGAFLQSGGANNVTGAAGVGNLNIASGGAYTLIAGSLDFQDTLGSAAHHTPNNPSTLDIASGGQFNFTGGTLLDVGTINANNAAYGGTPATTFHQNGVQARWEIGRPEDDGNPLNNFAGITMLNGNLLQTSGTIAFDVFGYDVNNTPEDTMDDMAVNPIDLLIVNGDAELAGTIDVDFLGVAPVFGDVFPLMKITGDLTIDPTFHIDGAFFKVAQDSMGNTTLQAIVPEPASVAIWSLLALAAGGFGLRLRRKKK